jgi:molecular chaperone GrpE
MTENNQSNSAAGSEEELAAAVDEALDAVATDIENIADQDPVAVLTNDLQRLQADFANYRKRVDRERLAAHELTTASVLVDLLPVLDDLDRAAQHNELTGGFKAVADRLTAITEKLGLTKFVETGVAFDPKIHDAISHETSADVTETTVTKVLQPGYRYKDRPIRVAMVVVADPE